MSEAALGIVCYGAGILSCVGLLALGVVVGAKRLGEVEEREETEARAAQSMENCQRHMPIAGDDDGLQ